MVEGNIINIMTHSCCVCLGAGDTKKTIRTCRVCADTTVCGDCFGVMRKTNIHRRCPVCRSEKWCPDSDSGLIIIHTDPFAEGGGGEAASVSITIIGSDYAPTEGASRGTIACRMLKCIIMGCVIWAIGFLMLSLTNDGFYKENIWVVIFGSILTGMIITIMGTIMYWASSM